MFLFASIAFLWPSGASLRTDPPVSTSQVDVFINMTTDGFKFVPDQFRVPANATVHVRIVQKDAAPHSFTVGREKDRTIPTNWTSRQLDTYLMDNNFTDVPIPGVADTVVWSNFTAPSEPGRYEFACRVPGHFQGGMFGFMIVERREVFVNMTTENLRFVPDRFTVAPGTIVHLRIVQKDSAPHTFTVGKERDRELPTTWNAQQIDSYFVDNNLTDVAIPAVVDTVVWANFTAPTEPGRYEFVCRVPGHFQGGMFGFMIVSEDAGAPPEPGPSIGLVPAIMIGTLGFVLVFAAVYHVRAVRASKRMK